MRALDGQPRGDGDLRAKLKRQDDTIDVLARRIARIPKPALTGSGGIVDIAKFDSTATFPSFAGIPWPSGSIDASKFDTTYGATTSMVTGDAVTWLSIADGAISPSADGYYQAWCCIYLQWDSMAHGPGGNVQAYLNGRDTPSSDMKSVYEVSSGSAVVSTYVTSPNEWMTTSDFWRLELDGDLPTSADIAVSSATWRITKYGATEA